MMRINKSSYKPNWLLIGGGTAVVVLLLMFFKKISIWLGLSNPHEKEIEEQKRQMLNNTTNEIDSIVIGKDIKITSIEAKSIADNLYKLLTSNWSEETLGGFVTRDWSEVEKIIDGLSNDDLKAVAKIFGVKKVDAPFYAIFKDGDYSLIQLIEARMTETGSKWHTWAKTVKQRIGIK